MSSRVLGPKTFTSAEILAQYRRVKLNSSGTVEYADAADNDNWIGTTEHAVASGYAVAILLRNAEGTRFFTASATENISPADELYPADDGKVTKTATGRTGIGFGAYGSTNAVVAAVDGDQFEAGPFNWRTSFNPSSIAVIGTTSNLTALVPAAATIADIACGGASSPSATDVNTAVNGLIVNIKTAMLLKADNVDVETLRTEVEARLDVIEAKLDALLGQL